MGERRIDDIDKVAVLKEDEADIAEANKEAAKSPLIVINYPRPTPLSTVLKDVAAWTGICFVMEPAADTRIQIFAPKALPPEEAYEAFVASLRVVGLRAVQQSGESVVKILPFSAFPVLI